MLYDLLMGVVILMNSYFMIIFYLGLPSHLPHYALSLLESVMLSGYIEESVTGGVLVTVNCVL